MLPAKKQHARFGESPSMLCAVQKQLSVEGEAGAGRQRVGTIFLPFFSPILGLGSASFSSSSSQCVNWLMAPGVLFLLGGKIRITQGTHMHVYIGIYTHMYTLLLPVAMYQALKSHSRRFVPPGWTFPPYSASTLLGTAGIPQTADKPWHPSSPGAPGEPPAVLESGHRVCRW